MTARTILYGLLLISLFSCKTAYKSGQTPDDIYLAESQPGGSVLFLSGSERTNFSADPFFRMRCRDRRWRYLLNDDPFDSPFAWQNCYSCYGSNINYHLFSDQWTGTILMTPVKNNTPRNTSLNTYGQNPVQATTNLKTRETKTFTGRDSYNNSNNNNIINRSQSTPGGGGRIYAPSGGSGRTPASGRVFSGAGGN